MDEGSGMQERSAPVFRPFPKESGPARRKGRARAATQRCPAGTPGQGHRGHQDRDTGTGTPDYGPLSGPFDLPPAPPSSGIPARDFPSSPSFPRDSLSGIPPSPSGCRDPLLQDPISALLATGILLQALCPQKSPFRNPPRTSPSAGIPAQGSSFQPLCPQGSLLRVSCSKSPFSPFHILQPLWDPPPTPPSSRISPPAPPDFSSSPPSPPRAQLPLPRCHP